MLQHLGIIMDGNRRYAKKNAIETMSGHKAGAEHAETIIELAEKNNIQYLTLWALSEDNFNKRNKKEINVLINLINDIENRLETMIQKGLKFETIGDITQLPQNTQDILHNLKEKTKHNNCITLILALVYGGQHEIIRGVQRFMQSNTETQVLTKEKFRNFLDSGKYPVIDMIIRTGGVKRHSGFLLYDCEYAEYYFSDKMWPEFGEEDFNDAIASFYATKRNFGK